MRIEFEQIKVNGSPEFDKIQARIEELREELAHEDDAFEAAMANQELEKLLKVRNAFVHNVQEESATAEADINNYLGIKGERRITNGALPGYIENIEAYMRPSQEYENDSMLLDNIEVAAKRLVEHLERKSSILFIVD